MLPCHTVHSCAFTYDPILLRNIKSLYTFTLKKVLVFSLELLATGWTVRGSNPRGGEFSTSVQKGYGAHKAFCKMGTEYLPCRKPAGAWRWPPTPHRTDVKESVELYLSPLSATMPSYREYGLVIRIKRIWDSQSSTCVYKLIQ